MKQPFIIVGAGGHALVVADALLSAGAKILGLTDPDIGKHGGSVVGLPVIGGDEALDQYTASSVQLANGVGSAGGVTTCRDRANVQLRLAGKGWKFPIVKHASAVISPFAEICEGTQMLANSVVQPGAIVGEGCIINTAAVIEHGCSIGAYSHVACGAVLCGNVSLGPRTHVGAGATIREGVVLGPDTIVGAGAVVLNNFPAGAKLIGVPALDWSKRL